MSLWDKSYHHGRGDLEEACIISSPSVTKRISLKIKQTKVLSFSEEIIDYIAASEDIKNARIIFLVISSPHSPERF